MEIVVLLAAELDIQTAFNRFEEYREGLGVTFLQELEVAYEYVAEKYFSKSDWEYLLTEALQRLNPGWKIRRTGGKAEAKHGTDILATTPDLFGDGELGVAIQVKDYQGAISEHPINQALKAKSSGCWKERDIEILHVIVVVVRGDKEAGHELQKAADKLTSG